jgi:hypothetical protein
MKISDLKGKLPGNWHFQEKPVEIGLKTEIIFQTVGQPPSRTVNPDPSTIEGRSS